MPQAQTGIFVEGATSSEYIEFEVAPGSLTSLSQLLPLFEAEQDDVGVNFVVGVRPSLMKEISPKHTPENVHDFADDVVGADGYVIPATQRDLVFWVFGGARDKVFDATRQLLAIAREVVPGIRVVDETEGWVYQTNRDLTGFVDGTENPTTIEQYDEAVVTDGKPGEGSSVLLLQKWPHKQKAWESLSTEEQEGVIGRTKVDSVELEDKPETSHAERTDQDDFGHIVRRNMPYGDVSSHGTMFVGFACEQKRLHDMLESMAGVGDYPRDALTKYSNAETGSYYVIPPVDAFKG
ncbi:hypothetical protein AA983_05110 [Dermacoccus sp. PE3]|uniref:Dyp-type peroxidase n=1 Tax=Dermacoccus sp. PE3 TaxID=1641401 RepID=UPI00064276ED|nr:Dyp-type peroxidase [Dermacoccus sp. PE3]KLO64034.1 hypothetical protein AA983_05110 [Dermacoccus sp. PE3]